MRVRGPTIATFLAEAEESLALLGSQLKKSHSDALGVNRGASLGCGERRRPLLSRTPAQSPKGASPRKIADATSGHTQSSPGVSGLDSCELSRSVNQLLEHEEDVKEQLAVQAKTLLRVDRRLQALECRVSGPEVCDRGEGGPSSANPGLGSPRDVKDFCEQQFQRLQAETRQHVEDLGKSLRQWLADTEGGLQVVWEQHLARDRVEDAATCMTQSTSSEEHFELPEKAADRPAPALEEADAIVEEGHLPGQLLEPRGAAPRPEPLGTPVTEATHAMAMDAAEQLLGAGRDHVALEADTPLEAPLELDGASSGGSRPEASSEAPDAAEVPPAAEAQAAASEEPKPKPRSSVVLVGVQDPNALKPPSPGRCSPVIPVVRRRNYDSLFNFSPSDRDHGASSSLFHGPLGTDTAASEAAENLRRGFESLGFSRNTAAAAALPSGPPVNRSSLSEELAQPPSMDREASVSAENVSETDLATGSEPNAAPAAPQSGGGGEADQAKGDGDHFQEEAVPAPRSPSPGSDAPAAADRDMDNGPTRSAAPTGAAEALAGIAAPMEASNSEGTQCSHSFDHGQLSAGVEGSGATGAIEAPLAAADALPFLAAWPGRAVDSTPGDEGLHRMNGEDSELEQQSSNAATTSDALPCTAQSGGPAAAARSMGSDDEGNEASSSVDRLPMSAGQRETSLFAGCAASSSSSSSSPRSMDAEEIGMSLNSGAAGLAASVGPADRSSSAGDVVDAPGGGLGDPDSAWDALAQSLGAGLAASVGPADRSSSARDVADTPGGGLGDPDSAWDALAQSLGAGLTGFEGRADHSSSAREAGEASGSGPGDPASTWDALAQRLAPGRASIEGCGSGAASPRNLQSAPAAVLPDSATKPGRADDSVPSHECAQLAADEHSANEDRDATFTGATDGVKCTQEALHLGAADDEGCTSSEGESSGTAYARDLHSAPTAPADLLPDVAASQGAAGSVPGHGCAHPADDERATFEDRDANFVVAEGFKGTEDVLQLESAGTQLIHPADTPQMEVEDLNDHEAGPAQDPAVVASALALPASGTLGTHSTDPLRLDVEDVSDVDGGPAEAPAAVASALLVPAAGALGAQSADTPRLDVEDVSDVDVGPAEVPAAVSPALMVPATGTSGTQPAHIPQLEVEDVSDVDVGPAEVPAAASPAALVPAAGTSGTQSADTPRLEVEDVSDVDVGPAEAPAAVSPALLVPAAGTVGTQSTDTPRLEVEDVSDVDVVPAEVPAAVSPALLVPAAGDLGTRSADTPQLEVEDLSDDNAGPAEVPALVAPASRLPTAGALGTCSADTPQMTAEDMSEDDAVRADAPAVVAPALPVPAAGILDTRSADTTQLEVEDVSDDDASPAEVPAAIAHVLPVPATGNPGTGSADTEQLEVETVSDDDAGHARPPADVAPSLPVPAAGAQHASKPVARHLDSDDEGSEASILVEKIPTSTSRGQSVQLSGPAAATSHSSSAASSPRRSTEVELNAKPQLIEVAGGWNGDRPRGAFPAAASSSSSSGDSSDEGADSADELPLASPTASHAHGGAQGGSLRSGWSQDAACENGAPCTVDTFAAAVASSLGPSMDLSRAGRPPCNVESFSAAVASTLVPAGAADRRSAGSMCLDDEEPVSRILSTE